MKERIQPNGLIIQSNDPNDHSREPIYAKAFMPNQFEETINMVKSYYIYRPVAVWKIKYDPNNYFKNITIKG